jgi:hypothetical protein
VGCSTLDKGFLEKQIRKPHRPAATVEPGPPSAARQTTCRLPGPSTTPATLLLLSLQLATSLMPPPRASHQPDATTQSPQRGEEARRERRSMPYLASGLPPSLLLAGWISPPVVESPRSFCRGPALTCGGERRWWWHMGGEGCGGAGTWREREAHDRGQDPAALAQARGRRGRRSTLEREDREAMGMGPGLVTARDGGRNRQRRVVPGAR